jgi:hypothetical protein
MCSAGSWTWTALATSLHQGALGMAYKPTDLSDLDVTAMCALLMGQLCQPVAHADSWVWVAIFICFIGWSEY